MFKSIDTLGTFDQFALGVVESEIEVAGLVEEGDRDTVPVGGRFEHFKTEPVHVTSDVDGESVDGLDSGDVAKVVGVLKRVVGFSEVAFDRLGRVERQPVIRVGRVLEAVDSQVILALGQAFH